MGTNYYARRIPTKARLKELHTLLDNTVDCDGSWDIIRDQVQLTFGRRGQYNDGNEYHLGKKSYGWKFLWNPNIRPHYDYETKKHSPEYVYPLTRKGITDFVMQDDIVIVDEYQEVQDKQEFLKFFDSEGYDSEQYTKETEEPVYHADYSRYLREIGYNVRYNDFYSDGLRFSTSMEFS